MRNIIFLLTLLLVAMTFLLSCESEAPMPIGPEPVVYPDLNVELGISNVEGYVPFVATTIAMVSGGSGEYTYELYQDGQLIDTNAIALLHFNEVRSYNLNLKVFDLKAKDTAEASVSVVGLQTPPGLPLEAWLFTADFSGYVPFDVSVLGGAHGGVPPYSYEIYQADQLISNQETAKVKITEVGNNRLTFKVRDANGDTALAVVDIEGVESDPSLPLKVSLVAFPPEVDTGQQVILISEVFGGEKPYRFKLSVDGELISEESMALYRVNTLGILTAEVVVTDALGNVVKDTASMVGLERPVYIPPVLSVDASAAPSVLDVGYPTTLDADVTGGVLPFTYKWTCAGTVFANTESASFIADHPGDYELTVVVTDSIGQVDSQTVVVTFQSSGTEVVSWQVQTDLKAGPYDKHDAEMVNTTQDSSWNRIWFYCKMDVRDSYRKSMTLEFVYADGSRRYWTIPDVIASRPAYLLVDGGEALIEPVIEVNWYYPGGTSSPSGGDGIKCDDWNRVLEISGSREVPAKYSGVQIVHVESTLQKPQLSSD